MKNILLVGCSGGIGNAAAKELIKRGYMVYGLDLMDKIEENNRFRFYSCKLTDEESKKIIDINVFGSMRIVKTFFPLLTKGSRILLTTSEVANLDPLPFNSLYTMSKSLLENMPFL